MFRARAACSCWFARCAPASDSVSIRSPSARSPAVASMVPSVARAWTRTSSSVRTGRQPLDQRERAPTPLARAVEVVAEHLQPGAVAVGHRLGDGRGAVQQLDRGPGLLLGLVVAPGEPLQPRLAPPGVTHAHRVAELLPQPSGGIDGLDRGVDAPGEVVLVAQVPQQLGALRRRQAAGVVERPEVLPHRLPVRAQLGRQRARSPPVPQDRVAVAAASAWWARRAGSAPRSVSAARSRRCRWTRRPAGISSATASRASSWRKTTSSPDWRSRPRSSGSSSAVSPAPSSAPTSSDSAREPASATSSRARCPASPRRDTRASTASRTVGGSSPVPAWRASVTKKGLPPVTSLQPVGVRAPVLRREPGDAGARQWCQVDPPGPGRRRRVTQQHPERVAARRVLGAIADHHQRAAGVDASREVPEQVEGRLVRPVRVLDHHEVRPAPGGLAQLREEVGEHLRAGGVGRPDPGRQARQHVAQRAERHRGRRARRTSRRAVPRRCGPRRAPGTWSCPPRTHPRRRPADRARPPRRRGSPRRPAAVRRARATT